MDIKIIGDGSGVEKRFEVEVTNRSEHSIAWVGEYIVKLQDELEVTSIVVTHDLALANQISDSIALLFDGRTAIQGAPEDVAKSGNEEYDMFVSGKI